MVDIYSREKRSKIMTKNQNHNGVEKLPNVLKFHGLHRNPKGIHGNPDFANKKKKLAVFIDGCFWHGCPEHYHEPENNKEYWAPKIEKRRERDREVTETLKKKGWCVIRLWEHDLK